MVVKGNIIKKKHKKIKQEDWDDINSPSLSKKIINRMKPVSKAHPNTPARVRGPELAPTEKRLIINM